MGVSRAHAAVISGELVRSRCPDVTGGQGFAAGQARRCWWEQEMIVKAMAGECRGRTGESVPRASTTSQRRLHRYRTGGLSYQLPY